MRSRATGAGNTPVTITRNWRIAFRWRGEDALDVDFEEPTPPDRCPTHPGAVLREIVFPELRVSKTAIAEAMKICRNQLYLIHDKQLHRLAARASSPLLRRYLLMRGALENRLHHTLALFRVKSHGRLRLELRATGQA